MGFNYPNPSPIWVLGNNHSIGPFKMGAFHAAIEADCPILPITILGSREWMPRGARTPISGEIKIIQGD